MSADFDLVLVDFSEAKGKVLCCETRSRSFYPVSLCQSPSLLPLKGRDGALNGMAWHGWKKGEGEEAEETGAEDEQKAKRTEGFSSTPRENIDPSLSLRSSTSPLPHPSRRRGEGHFEWIRITRYSTQRLTPQTFEGDICL